MKNLFLYPIIFLLLNSAGGIYFKLAKNETTFLLVFLLVFYFVFFNNKIKKNNLKTSLVVLFVFILLLGFNYLVALPGQSLETYAYFVLVFFIAFLSINLLYNEQLLDKMYKVLVFIEIHSLVGFLLYLIVRNNLQALIIEDKEQYLTFHYLFFYLVNEESHLKEVGSLQMMRNQGVYWEPGILQLFLNMLLFLKLFYYPKSFSNIAITLMAILSTFSTTGLLIMSILMIYRYKSLLNSKKLVFYFPVAIVVIGLLIPIMTSNIEEKLYGKNEASSMGREWDSLQALLIIQDFPATGIGITHKVIEKLQDSYRSVSGARYQFATRTGTTNSILSTLYMFGLPIGFFYLYLLYQQRIFYNERGLFFLMLFMGLNSEPIMLRPFFFFLMFSGLQNILITKKSKTHQASFNKLDDFNHP